MGRSKATFNKKELESKKIKKRKDKEEKKEERKLNSSKGKGIEDMMAYVDEDGNISDTPPDPNKKKKVIKKEDMIIGVAAQKPMDEMDIIRKGVVTFFNESKGYGFIKDMETQESVFVHINSLKEPIKENNMVTFEVEMSPKGASAIKVKKA